MNRITVDRSVCVGAGLCVLTAPDLFHQSESDGRVVRTDAVEPDDEDLLTDVVDLCPSGALSRSPNR